MPALLVVVPAGVRAGMASDEPLQALGLEYRLHVHSDPRPNRVHVLRVDLANGKSHPDVVLANDPDGDGPAEAALTDPRILAGDPSVLAFVNTNPWESFPDASGRRNRKWFVGQPVDIRGLAISGGRVRSCSPPDAASVWFDAAHNVFLEYGPDDAPVEAMAGFQRIVEDGAIVVPAGGKRHPRTAIGTDRGGEVLWLVVVDGRQSRYSEGMTLEELARVMRDVGCWDATNMDGGGSSIMGLVGADGRLRVVNSPSDRRGGKPRIRPLPAILTIRTSSRAASPDTPGPPATR